jgi:hypothetical protein
MKKRSLNRLLIILISITLAFIWVNSALPSAESNTISDKVTKAVGGEVLDRDTDEDIVAGTWLTDKHVRKLAHGAEYGILAVEIVLLIVLSERKIPDKLSTIILAGLCVALIDETIQLFNDRTSMVEDIWIDMSGFLIGALITWYIYQLVKKKKAEKTVS